LLHHSHLQKARAADLAPAIAALLAEEEEVETPGGGRDASGWMRTGLG